MSWFRSLQGIGDVSKVTPSNLDLLQYNSTTKIWELVQLSSIETDPVFSSWLLATPPLYSETDPLSLHIDQATPQIILNGAPIFNAGLSSNFEVRIQGESYDSLVKIEQQLDWATGGYDNYALEVIGYTILGGIRLNGADAANALYLSGGQLGFTADIGQPISFSHWSSPNNINRLYIDGAGLVSIGSNTVGGNLNLYATLSEKAVALEAANWTCTNGWSAGSGQLVRVNNASTGTATPSATTNLTAGRTYLVTIVCSAVSGAITCSMGGITLPELTATTTTTYVTVLTTAKIVFSGVTTTTCTITSLSIEEMTPATGDLTVDGNITVNSPSYFNSTIFTQNGYNHKFLMLDGSDDGTGFKRNSSNAFFLAYAGNSMVFQATANHDFRIWNSGGSAQYIFKLASGESVFNEQAADINYRFEGTTNPNLLFLDAGTNRVGIGTAAPAMPLHLYNSSNGDGSNERIRVENNGGAIFDLIAYGSTNSSYPHLAGNAFLNCSHGNLLIMANGGLSSFLALFSGGFTTTNERMRIIGTGEIGIGTTVPLRALDINQASGNCLRLIYNDNNGSPAYYTDFLISPAGKNTQNAVGGFGWQFSGVEQINLTDGVLAPTTTNDIDLGDSSHIFKNAYINNYFVGSTAGIDATIPIAPVSPATVAGSATFTKGILTSYTAPS